uniref:ribosomal protein S6 kinase delta-1 n=1 Tax=Monopterus albus TaxID=43700 RepID=UPI0009B2ED91|nr:ribosomal protein S6 kinase delta-1 [Monopterus albus]
MISQRDRGEFARFYTVTDPKKHQKGYTVYKVTARIISRKNPEDVQEIVVWKRYSDFRKLHHNLWQLHKNVCSQSELFPPFAKAKVFGRFDDSVIEERRQCSEDLLQFSANIPALYASQHIQDFFKGGEVHDGSELIGPAEPFSDFLVDSLSDCSSDVQRDISGADDLTITSEYGGPSSDSDLTSLAVDTDSLAGLDEGMPSGRPSPNQPQGEATNISSSCSPRLPTLHERRILSPAPVAASSAPNPEISWPGRMPLFSSSLKKASGSNTKDVKSGYLDKASELIGLAIEKEKQQDYRAAFSYYHNGVDLLLQGVQGEPSPTRREAVKKKTAEYLMRAELISSQHLKSNMGQGSPQAVALGAQCCASTSRGGQQIPSEELRAYRVLGVIDKVLLVMDKRTQETFILKGLRKSSDCERAKKTIMPHSVPHMVQLRKFIVSEDTVFLLLHYAEGGKLWSHIQRYLRTSSPEDSFDIPFIQKSHTAAVHSPQHIVSQLDVGSASSGSGLVAGSGSGLQKEGENFTMSALKSVLLPRLVEQTGAQSDSGTTSEEECTNSYLTLCNEYEQEKVDPDALEEEDEKSEQEMLSLEVPTALTTTSSRSRSLLSNDSLSSPISSQELGFFTESSDKSGHTHDNEQYCGEGQDHSEVFSPLSSPAVPLSLDQSKHTPMEFFRIDSKDSASEVTCLDLGEQHTPYKQVPLFLASDPGSDVTEYPPELAQEVKGHGSEFWGLDCSDKGSNESVPVISFKEAVGEDEGHPPDLLVNLPVMSGTVDSLQEELETSRVCLGPEAPASPQKFIQPDVLQLHSQPEGEEQPLEQELSSLCTAAVTCDTSVASSSTFNSLWDDCVLTFEQKASDKMVLDSECHNNDLHLEASSPDTDSHNEKLESSTKVNTELVSDSSGNGADSILATSRADACEVDESLLDLDGEPSGVISNTGVIEFDKAVSRLFAELDELSLAASQARIPEEFVRCWAAEIVMALDYLHQEGIICRDLNPNNILLDHQGHVQITYFCSWSDVEECCDKDAIANIYCAPEVGGISEETAACDWWSLGAILFELLTGMVSQKVSLLLRCCGMSVGVLAFRSLALFLVLPGCVSACALNIPEFVSEEARSLLQQLLQYNPMERLGAGVGGVDDIKSHPFFARVDWLK